MAKKIIGVILIIVSYILIYGILMYSVLENSRLTDYVQSTIALSSLFFAFLGVALYKVLRHHYSQISYKALIILVVLSFPAYIFLNELVYKIVV